MNELNNPRDTVIVCSHFNVDEPHIHIKSSLSSTHDFIITDGISVDDSRTDRPSEMIIPMDRLTNRILYLTSSCSNKADLISIIGMKGTALATL